MNFRLSMVFASMAILLTSSLSAATATSVRYELNGELVGRMTYSGKGSWDASKYWKLLAYQPWFAYDIKIRADQPRGRTATLKGKIRVTIDVGAIDLNVSVVTDRLSLIRNDGEEPRWYLPKKEMKRLLELAEKEDADNDK